MVSLHNKETPTKTKTKCLELLLWNMKTQNVQSIHTSTNILSTESVKGLRKIVMVVFLIVVKFN